MSLNAAISQEYLVETKALLALLEKYVSRWNSASTLEERLLVEADAVSTFERLLELQVYLDYVKPGDHPDLNDLGRVYSDWDFLLRLNSAKVQELTQQFLKRFNSQQIALMELTSMMKRIRQKRSALSLWTRDKARYVLAERFLNFDSLDSRFTSVTECDVDTNQGVLTLPVRNKTQLVPKTARIGSASNGQPGNSDEDVQTNNANPEYAINGDDGNWFEYERLDVGPVDLDLIIEFPQPQIINNLTIEPVNLGLSLSYEILDITFSTSGSTETSIHNLVSGATDADFFTIKSVGNDTAWALSFLPIQASVVNIKLRQRQGYNINMVSGDDRKVLRHRYAVALKDISFYRIQYNAVGGINSKVLNIPTGLYAAEPFSDVWPQNSSFFTEHLEVSADGGVTWTASNLPLTPGEDPTTVLLQGDQTDFVWRITLERNDEAFVNLTSFVEEENPILETNSIQRGVSRYQSPVDIPLSEVPKDGRVFVMQPKLARRGNRLKGIHLGSGGGQEVSFELPISILKNDIDPTELKVFVARREYTRTDDNSSIATGEWAFSDDYNEILFGTNLPANSDIRVVFDEELMSVEERSDGYYHKMKLLFDPDKENINIWHLPRESQRVSRILPRHRTIISLGYTNILSDSLKLTSRDGTVFTEVFTKAEVLDIAANEYYVDYVNGVLYLDAELGDEVVKATFLHQAEVLLDKDAFEVVIENNRPWGIRINKDAFVSQTITETVGSGLSKRINVLDGLYTTRSDYFSGANDAKTLSYDCIINGTLTVSDDFLNTSIVPEQVAFIDGKSEFLGLIPMNKEETVSITASGQYVEFSLGAAGLWYNGFDVVFSDGTAFANKVGSASAARTGALGDYYIDESGLVTVNVDPGGTLPAGISINYYYRDPGFDPVNKYSVDYENGVVYSYTNMNSDATIEYRASCHKIAYDIAKEIDTYQYNSSGNTVSVRTEGLSEINNLVKIIWTKAPTTSDLLALKEFFSPILSILAFRFN